MFATRQRGGADVRFNWTDVACASGYVVFEDALPSGTFTIQTGSAMSVDGGCGRAARDDASIARFPPKE